jgi:hypothetical protein
MNKKLKKSLAALKIVIAQRAYQPNCDSTLVLLLSEEDLPGSGWKQSLQQTFPTGALAENDPIMTRAKQMKSTTARRQFGISSSTRSLLVAIAPLGSSTDAQSWVATTDERTKRNLSKIEDVGEFHLIDDVFVSNVGVTRGFTYTFSRPEGLRLATVVATSVDELFTSVTGLSFGEPWSIDEVLEVVRAQVDKIQVRRASGG